LSDARAITVATWTNLSSLVTHKMLGSNKTADNVFFIASHEPAEAKGKWRGIVLARHRTGYGFGVSSRTGEQANALSDIKPVTGVWFHTVGVLAGRKARLYINGKQQSETPHAHDLFIADRPLYLGRTGCPDYDAFLPARQDEVAIWNRGLSDKEIRELYDYSSRGKSYCQAIGEMRAAAIRKVAYENLLGMKFVKLPAGEFMMGLGEEEVKGLVAAHRVDKRHEAWIRTMEFPKHRVRITRDFFMGIHEVTQAQYRKAMGQITARHRGDNRPAELDDWRPAEDFCRWLNTNDNQRPEGYEYRLPTEAEWEYACRAGSTTPFHFGQDARQAGDYAWFSGNSPRVTHDVGLKKPNAWGLYDMYGNVWEWCEDWFSEDYYKGSPENDPRNRRPGPNHVGRGASWGDPAFWCRSTLRIGPPRLNPIGNHGFRVVLAPRRKRLAGPQYLVVDISGGQKAKRYPVTALIHGPPADLLTDKTGPDGANKYKTTCLVLRRIPAGRFLMGSPENEPGHEPDEVQHEVLLTRDFYAGVFEATQAQYQIIMGVNPSKFVQLPEAPVETVSWIEVRGGKWPGGRPAPGSFLDRLSAKTGIAFDLPTDAQWEYACRAGTTTSYNSDRNLARAKGKDSAMDEVGWYEHNARGKTHPVGLKRPNAWGLYDFHGNCWEWCLDWMNHLTTRPMADPTGPKIEEGRLLRGGWWKDAPDNCRSAERTGNEPDSHDNDGFRVFMPETGNVTLYENEMGMKFVGIPAGEFMRGTPEAEVKALAAKHKGDKWFVERLKTETPQHKVRITEAFLMGCCEVTVGQFRKFVEATGHKTRAERRGGASVFAGGKWQQPTDADWRKPYYQQTDSHPVTCVSWHDAKAFCNWLNWYDNDKPKGWRYRLPTEAEWEYACRAGTTTAYSFGSDAATVDDYGWTNRNSGGRARKVADKKVIASTLQDENGNAWGLYDMHGNAWEWCEDWFSSDAYENAAKEDPINIRRTGKRTMRGGSWRTSPESARAAFHTEDPPDGCWNNVGFRVVLSPRKASMPRDLKLVWTSEDSDGTYCIAWADVDKDGDPDLTVGNKWSKQHYKELGKTKLYRNEDGKLVLAWSEPIAGPTECDDLDWGDFDGDGDLDLAVGNDKGHPTRVYENKDGKLTLAWASADQDRTCGVGWGDFDGDGDLDLAVANQDQPNRVFRNDDGKLTPVWESPEKDNSNVVEWADFDGDGDLDLAVGNGENSPNRVYRNEGGTLELAWTSPYARFTCSLAWGDWDQDGDPDLAIGNEAQPNHVYENRGGKLIQVWSSEENDNTRSVAWGDWDNDGDLDLACGNEGHPNRIYENVGGDLVLAWSSKERDQTVSAAWADVDGDGFLDLACGNKGVNRLYRNVAGSELIARYDFSGDAKDTSGNNWHGGIVGTEPARNRFDKPNSALHFDGEDDVVEVTDFVSHQFPVEFSLSFWFWTRQPFDRKLVSLLQQMTGPNNVSSFSIRGAQSHLNVELVRPGGENYVWRYPLKDYLMEWQHVAVVKERKRVKTYLNTALIGNEYANFLLNLSDQPLNIGGSKPEKGLYFGGAIDDVTLFAKALTERDISLLYNEGNWPALVVQGRLAIQKLQAALKENDPKYNGKGRLIAEGGKIVEAWFSSTGITDISPLKGQPLRLLELYKTTVSDLSAVEDMPLEWLNLTDTTVTDLSVLKGKPLRSIIMHRCPATDLTPLEGAPLERLTLTPKTIKKGWEVLRNMKTLEYLGESFGKRTQPAAEFWKKYDAGEFRQSETSAIDF
jgi:formylglycine-generating enzyme required for sulfatase activity